MADFLELMRLKRLSANTFESLSFPQPMGPAAYKVAFGGGPPTYSRQLSSFQLNLDLTRLCNRNGHPGRIPLSARLERLDNGTLLGPR